MDHRRGRPAHPEAPRPAAAADGAANAAVIALLSKTLGRPKSAIAILRGDTARVKQVEVEGLDPADLDRALGAPPKAS